MACATTPSDERNILGDTIREKEKKYQGCKVGTLIATHPKRDKGANQKATFGVGGK